MEMALPPIFYFLIKFTGDKKIMGVYVNNTFQQWFAIMGTVVVCVHHYFKLLVQVFHF